MIITIIAIAIVIILILLFRRVRAELSLDIVNEQPTQMCKCGSNEFVLNKAGYPKCYKCGTDVSDKVNVRL